MAYEVAKNHSLDDGNEYAEAEWLSGWIALTFLNNPNLALKHFNNFYKNVGYPISLSRGAYWLGVTYEKLGKNKLSEELFKEGSKYLTTYYGQLSFQKLNPFEEFELKDDSKYSKEYEKEFNKNILVKHLILLKELDKSKYGKDILKHLADLDINKGSEVLAAKLATQLGRYDYAILRCTIHFGKDNTVHWNLLMKLSRLYQRILSKIGIQCQQGFQLEIRKLFRNYSMHFLNLGHKIFISM